MVIQVTSYVFVPGGAGVGTITFSGYVSIELKNVILITNVTDGEIIYNFRIPGNTGTVATNVLTLMESTAAMSAGDELQIIYNDPTLTADTSTLAKESGGNLALSVTALQIIDDWDEANRAAVNLIAGQVAISAGAGAVAANTPRVTHASDDPAVTSLGIIDDWDESDRAKVNPVVGQAGVAAGAGAVSANTQRVTHASDDPVTTSLQLIDDTVATDGAATPTKSVSIAGTDGTNAQTLKTDASGELQVDVLSQPALSQNTDAVLIYGSDDGGTTKRVIKTDATGEIQVDISSSTLALEATLQSVKTAVEIIDNFISGARGLVTEDNSAAILAALQGTLTITGTIIADAGSNLDTSALALETTLQDVKAAVELLDDAVSGTELRVDVVTPLPAGSNIIGSVDVNSLPALPAGTNNIGDVDVLTQPARVATVDSITAKIATDKIQDGLTALTPKFAIIDVATSGDNTLLAAVTAKKIRILSLYMVASAAVTARFESGAAGTALSGQMQLAANGGFVLPFNPVGWFETASGVLFNLELSGAISVDGGFTYIEV